MKRSASSSHVTGDLLAYLDGELDAAARTRVEAHLAVCSQCAEALETLRQLQLELHATFDLALTPIRLPPSADRRILATLHARVERPSSFRWLVARTPAWAFQALLAVLVLAFIVNTVSIGPALLPATALPTFQETMVLGQEKMAPGAPVALRVLVRSFSIASSDSTAPPPQPVANADITVRLGRTPGLASVVYTGRTGDDGSADVAFTVPPDLTGRATLIVEAASPDGEEQNRVVHPITIVRSYKLLLSSDKPVYRPGQTLHLRAVALDAVTLRPAAGETITFTVQGPAGYDGVISPVVSDDFGVAFVDIPLSIDAPHGTYTATARIGDIRSERAISVGAYELPAFRVTLETERPFYLPGDLVTGRVEAAYFFGKPVAGAAVTIYSRSLGERAAGPSIPGFPLTGQTDADGHFVFTFTVPTTAMGQETLRLGLEASVVDRTGRQEGVRRELPVASAPVLIQVAPESGWLKPGVENVLYILTARPDGQPVETDLTITLDGASYSLATGPYGLAEFRFTPTAATAWMEVQARDVAGNVGREVFTLQSDSSPVTLLLRAERAVYQVGQTVRAEALVSWPRAGAGAGNFTPTNVFLDVVRAGHTQATLSAPIEDGRATFALDLDEGMMGTVELHAYLVMPDDTLVMDTRPIIVDAPRQVAVAVATDQDVYRPGETVHLTVETADRATGQPLLTALGIGVVDESVYALETQTPGFVRTYFLLDRELRTRTAQAAALDLPALLEAEADMRAAQDLSARAAWAGVTGADFSITARDATPAPQEIALPPVIARRLQVTVALLVLIPISLALVVGWGTRQAGLLRPAVRRVALGSVVLTLASPLAVPLIGRAMWALWQWVGPAMPLTLAMVVIALWIGLTILGWRWRDRWFQLATGLLGAYLALFGLALLLAAWSGKTTGQAVSPLGLMLALLAFVLLLLALATLGQAMVAAGRTVAGWTLTLLAFLLFLTVLCLPFVPFLDSGLTRELGNPAWYAGPLGWLTGCGAPTTMKTMETMVAPVEVTVETVAEEETEVEPPMETLPTPLPTATAASASPLPLEPFPLRQLFPETLYWNPTARTDDAGRWSLDLPLADSITTWKLLALASTRDGKLGMTTYDIVVFQDFFVSLDLPAEIHRGDEITATVSVYNYTSHSQTVEVELLPGEWYDLISAPRQTVTLPSNDIAVAHFVLRAGQMGDFTLQVNARSAHLSDAVQVDMSVLP